MVDKRDSIVLGVDLDGVCADFYARMREIASEWFERPLRQLTKDVSYGLPEWGIRPGNSGDYESLHRFAVTSRDLFKTVPIIKGARRVLRQLSGDGFRIRIVTHRLFIHYFHAMAVQQTIEWLDYQGIPYSDLCFMKDKAQVGADIYVEDSPTNVPALRARGCYTICFSNSTNRDVPAPRADTWDQVYGLIKAQERRITQKAAATTKTRPGRQRQSFRLARRKRAQR